MFVLPMLFALGFLVLSCTSGASAYSFPDNFDPSPTPAPPSNPTLQFGNDLPPFSPSQKFCYLPIAQIEKLVCDSNGDGWITLAKEFVTTWKLGLSCPSVDLHAVWDLLANDDYCTIGALSLPQNSDVAAAVDAWINDLRECNGEYSQCPCNVDEPCRCTQLRELITDKFEEQCELGYGRVPELDAYLAQNPFVDDSMVG